MHCHSGEPDQVQRRQLAPAYLQGRALPQHPDELARLDCLAMRSRQTGKIRGWMMRTANGAQTPLALQPRTVVNDPDALCHCTLLGMGVALLAMPDVLQHLERGALQRVLPQWYVDAGPISLYFASNKLLPVKTRAFVDFVTGHFQQHQLARRLSAG